MGIPRNFPTGTVSVLLVRIRNIVERQAVQWIDGPKKTGVTAPAVTTAA